MTTTPLRPPMPYYGGKQTLGPHIADLLPAHEHYVEPYAGGLSVLLAKPPARVETVNDLDDEIVTFWRVLRDRHLELERVCALTPHSRAEHAASFTPTDLELEVARRVFVRLTQGRMARMTSSGWRNIVTVKPRGSASMATYLRGYLARVAPAADRLMSVQLECRPALEIVETYGGAANTLLYVDPPYLRETRNGTNYRLEMADAAEHRELAAALHRCAAAVMLSGYASDLYDLELYPGWHRVELASLTTQGGARAPRTEVLWSNRPLTGAA